MKIVGAVFADFVKAATGGPSHLRTELGGQMILARTLQRLLQVEGLAARCLFVRPRDQELAARTLAEAGLAGRIDLVPGDTSPRARRDLICAARKWSLEAWRGNPLGATWFDEFADPLAVALVSNHYGCEGVFCFDGHQPVLDPQIAAAMLGHLAEHEYETKVVFTQAPPGLAGIIIRRETLEDLLELDIPLGLLFSYRPELAQPDVITQSGCYHVRPEIMQTPARLTGDTLRSRELLEPALRELGEGAGAFELCAWVRQAGHERAGGLPVEVELELTTTDPLPNTTLRPRGTRVPRRQLDDVEAVARLAAQLAEYDDRAVFIGGHGDPLQHPHFAEVCRLLRTGGVNAIGVGTPLVDLPEAALAALFEHTVDAIEVRLDAFTAATYRQVHGVDHFERVLGNVERIEKLRRERSVPQPLVVCSQTRCAATLAELEGFHDHWIKVVGSAVINGYNEYGGAMPVDSLLPICPPLREPCRRLGSRLILLADGVVPLCGQDIGGREQLGDWRRDRLRDIWSGTAMQRVRQAHASGSLEAVPQCVPCKEWFRP